MPHLLLICCGNSVHNDDAIGPAAARLLHRFCTGPEVEILTVHQLTPELMEPIGRSSRVIFVDAAVGGTPGAMEEREIRADAAAAAFTHSATPEGLMAGARALYGAAPAATLITVAGANFEFGESLSEAAREGVARAVARIASLCEGVYTSPGESQ